MAIKDQIGVIWTRRTRKKKTPYWNGSVQQAGKKAKVFPIVTENAISA